MGFHLIQESGQLIPADIGIKDGDEVFCTVVGGGAGGENAKDNKGQIVAYGGESGRSGRGGTDSGGGGGGFGAGGGGGGSSSFSVPSGGYVNNGSGGGSGSVVQKIIKISDVKTPITVSIAQKVPAETEGQPTTFGDITARGGSRSDGGHGGQQSSGSYSGGAGGGGGGFQIGTFANAATAARCGAGNAGRNGVITGGAGGGSSCKGGPGGGGDPGQDGWTFLHSGGNNSGCVLLIW